MTQIAMIYYLLKYANFADNTFDVTAISLKETEIISNLVVQRYIFDNMQMYFITIIASERFNELQFPNIKSSKDTLCANPTSDSLICNSSSSTEKYSEKSACW